MYNLLSLDLMYISRLCEWAFPPAAAAAGTEEGGKTMFGVCYRARCKMLCHGSFLHFSFKMGISKIAFIE